MLPGPVVVLAVHDVRLDGVQFQVALREPTPDGFHNRPGLPLALAVDCDGRSLNGEEDGSMVQNDPLHRLGRAHLRAGGYAAMGSITEGIRIQTLGRFRVVASGREVREARRQPVRSALLVYLAMEREATRDTLLGIFWPDRTEAEARHALSQTLHKLRRDLAAEWIQAEGEALLVADRVEIDARAFEQAVEGEDHGAALTLYAGHFLEGWRLHDKHQLELWVDRQRERLLRLFGVASREHIRHREAAGDLKGALTTARRRAELNPLDDGAQAALIELLDLLRPPLGGGTRLFQYGGPRPGERRGPSVGSPTPARKRAICAESSTMASSLIRPWVREKSPQSSGAK